MNCFHFSVSLGYKTTFWNSFNSIISLWIAFIFQYLWDTKQLSEIQRPDWSWLWIAFIFQYLWDTKQRMIAVWFKTYRCELLSFFSIFGIQNNGQKIQVVDESVVNCFHFSVSLGYKTTIIVNSNPAQQLWIAFIFQYLWDTKQQKIKKLEITTRCELLSFFSIFGIQNN